MMAAAEVTKMLDAGQNMLQLVSKNQYDATDGLIICVK
jgi:hypothetical protein